MASQPLPTPGQLIVDNITLLAGSPTAFHTRYGHTLTPTSFAKPGNSAPAHAVLHFLLTIIDHDVADSLFKPCFPILDRDQERDFRRVVDARLAILERTKLLPVGSARKSVVAAAGGDRFVDLLWSLSSLAVQQACLRHPAYGSVSRIRLISHQVRADALSHQSSARSTRSLLSGLSSRPDRPTLDSSRQRRFLGVGMLTAAQQRSKDAEQMRARIESERLALARTTEMGQQGAKTWASEADSLRDKIGDFEAKLRRLKRQLADMGFDENGVDIRAHPSSAPDNAVAAHHQPLQNDATAAPLVDSPSADDLADEFKTSPIESTESGSSVDELIEPVGCDDLASDLNHLLAFTADTRHLRADVDRALQTERPVLPTAEMSSDASKDSSRASESDNATSPQDIVHLVRAATSELEQATNRMHEIKEARRIAEANAEAAMEAGLSPDCPPVRTADGHAAEGAQGDVPSPEIEKITSSDDVTESLQEQVSDALESHQKVLEASRSLGREALELSERAKSETNGTESEGVDDSSHDTFVDAISKPLWYIEAAAKGPADARGAADAAAREKMESGRGQVNSHKDFVMASKAAQNAAPRKSRSAGRSRRRKQGSRSLDYISLSTNSRGKSPSTSHSTDALCTPSAANSCIKGTPRSVRFAELPPSYSATRTSDESDEGSAVRETRCSTEVYPKAASENKGDQAGSEGPEDLPMSPSDSALASTGDIISSGDASGDENKGSDLSNKDLACGRKSDGNRRRESGADKADVGRSTGVSSQKPPRIQRTQTPRRIMRRKEAIQRSVMPLPAASSKSRPPKPKTAQSFSLDSLTETRPSRTVGPSSSESLKNIAVHEETTSNEKVGVAAESAAPRTSHEIMDATEELGELKEDTESVQGSTEESFDQPQVSQELVQKRLFMTPESSASSSKPPRQLSRLSGKKQGVLRKSSGSVLSSLSPVRNRSSPGRESKHGAIPASLKETAIAFSSADDDELLFSPDQKPVSQNAPSSPKTSMGAGFFAGQTAQWQQNVRSQSNAELRMAQSALTRTSSESSGRLGKGSSSSGSGTGRRSRAQSFRARLAALK